MAAKRLLQIAHCVYGKQLVVAQDGESKMLFTVLGVGVMELEWLYLVLGVYCFAIAILNWFCCPYIVREKYRNETWCKAFQRNIALPYVIYGIATFFYGLMNKTSFEPFTYLVMKKTSFESFTYLVMKKTSFESLV
ncbi:MAG: hypothetical protein PHX08_05840 [Lachnospiraceae bacterium]|nr:hypothetical protein [Lachnospiraceae bacterium]